jgi:LacI family transcriptional regulator
MVDGLIIVNAAHPENSAVLKRLSKAGLPIVQADRHFEDLEIDTVEPDGAGLTSMLTNHLLELGHRAIAFLSSYHVHVGTRSRQRGYEQAMAARGLKTQVWSPRTADRGKIWKGTSYGYSRALVALREEPIPTAVVAHDVGGALGCVRAMQSLGLECPRDISVVGVERELDHDHENPLMRLQLTQAVWSVQEMGRRAARLLIDRLRTTGESRPAPRHELIGGRLQLGGSAVPPGHTSMKLQATRGS